MKVTLIAVWRMTGKIIRTIISVTYYMHTAFTILGLDGLFCFLVNLKFSVYLL